MADLSKIKRNVKRLVDGGAGPDQVEQYLGHEGVTRQQIRSHREPGMLETAGKFLHNTFIGTQDPKYKDVPDIHNVNTLENDPDASILAKMVGQTDAQYGDIVENNLKKQGRFLDRTKDANGFDLITFRNDLGEEQQAYVNKPGWDRHDLVRFGLAAAPFVATGGATGLAVKGAPLLAKAGAQAMAGAATSIGSDVAAIPFGSKQGVSPLKAAVAGGSAGVFEFLSPAIAAGFRKVFSSTKYIDEAGNFTPDGYKEVKKLGLDPDQITPEFKQQIFKDMSKANSLTELGAKIRTDEFGIPTTAGQRSKLPTQLTNEQAMRKGVFGPEAESVMKNFDTGQAESIKNAALGVVGRKIDDEVGEAGLLNTDLADIGRNIRGGMQEALKASQKEEGKLWKGLADLEAAPQGRSYIPEIIRQKLGKENLVPDRELHPNATKALKDLTKFWKGESQRSAFEILAEENSVTTIRQMQQRLLSTVQNAEKGDKKIAGAIYGAYSEWIDKIAEQGLLKGSPQQASQLKAARAFTREERNLFAPKDARQKATPGGKLMEKILEDDVVSPEGIVSMLFAESGTKGAPKAGVVQALRHMMRIDARGKGRMGAGLRAGYWASLVTNKKGGTLSPKIMKNNIETAFNKQDSVLKTLYTKDELSLMKRFAKALDDATWVDPNPSGTSYAQQVFKKQKAGSTGIASVAGNVARAGQRRAIFSKHSPLQARIWEFVGQNIRRIAGISADRSGGRRALDATRQTVHSKRTRTNPLLTVPVSGHIANEGVNRGDRAK